MAQTKTRNRPAASAPADSGTNLALAAGAGLAVGLAANFVRKAIVQAPTVAAGRWDHALAAEHKATLAIFDLIEKTDTSATARRSFLLMQLKHALAKHAMQEENAVYAALRDHGEKAAADELNGEHGYVKQYLYELTVMPRNNPAWLGKVREFRAMIEEHMREEENDIFPRLAAKLSETENSDLTKAMNKEGLKIA